MYFVKCRTGQRKPRITASLAASLREARLLNVLAIVDHVGYGSVTVHGAGVYLRNVLPALCEVGIQVRLVVLGEHHELLAELRRRGVDAVALGRSRSDPRVLSDLAGLLRTLQPDVVYAAQLRAAACSRVLAESAGLPWVVHIHDLVPVPTPLRAMLAMARVPNAHAICVSRAVAATMPAQYGVAAPAVTVLPNPLPPEAFRRDDMAADCARLRSELGIAATAPVGLALGRLHPVKGHRRLLQMLPGILQAVPEFQLLVAGDGPERADCEQLANALGIAPRVHWLGFQPRVGPLLAACDTVLITSESEGLSYVALEAAAAGRPVVAFDVGGLREAVAFGESGLAAPPFDESRFISQAVRVLTDRDLRERLSRGGLQTSRAFALGAHMPRLAGVFEAATEGTARDAGRLMSDAS